MGEAAEQREPDWERFTSATDCYWGLVNRLSSSETAGMSHSDLERFLEKEGRELLRQLLQGHLDLRAEAKPEGPVVGADGVERTHHRDGERPLETLVGRVTVARDGHGARGEKTLFPLDAELNLPGELYSFGVRQRASEEAAKGSYDDALEVLKKHSGARIAKRQLEEIVQRAAQDFDSFYLARRMAWQSQAPASSEVLVLTFDGKGVVVRHEDLRSGTKAAASRSSKRLEKRLTKGEKRNRKRMSSVAAVYTIAPFVRGADAIIGELRRDGEPRPKRPKPEGKRVWASVAKEPAEVIEEAFLDASSRDPERKKKWVVLVDGNADQLALVEAAAARHEVDVTIVLDVIHVVEYLWKAAYVFHAEGSSDAEAWVTERLLWLLCGDAGQVAAAMRRSATKRGLSRAARKPVDTCARYISNHRAYVRYDAYLAAGLPIATGVIEGACRHVVKDRMELTGARWSLAGAEAILRLRSMRASGDLDAYWHHHEKMERARNHEVLYANGEVPTLNRSPEPSGRNRKGPHLKVVK